MKCLKKLLLNLRGVRGAGDVSSPFLGWKLIKPSKDGFIYWHIVNFTDRLPKERMVANFEKVYEEFQGVMDMVPPSDVRIIFEPTKVYDQAHIRIVFAQPGKLIERIKCADGKVRTFYLPQMMDGPGGVLGYVPKDQHIIFLDASESWVDINERDGVSLYNTFRHENGHIFDLNHSDERGSFMNAYEDGKKRKITKRDRRNIATRWTPIKMSLKNG